MVFRVRNHFATRRNPLTPGPSLIYRTKTTSPKNHNKIRGPLFQKLPFFSKPCLSLKIVFFLIFNFLFRKSQKRKPDKFVRGLRSLTRLQVVVRGLRGTHRAKHRSPRGQSQPPYIFFRFCRGCPGVQCLLVRPWNRKIHQFFSQSKRLQAKSLKTRMFQV